MRMAARSASAEKRAILERNLRLLHRRWPGYHRQLARFRRCDPWRARRSAAILALATADVAGPLILTGPPNGDHADGVRRIPASGRGFVRITPDGGPDNYLIEVRRGPYRATLRVTDELELAQLTAGTPDRGRTASDAVLGLDGLA